MFIYILFLSIMFGTAETVMCSQSYNSGTQSSEFNDPRLTRSKTRRLRRTNLAWIKAQEQKLQSVAYQENTSQSQAACFVTVPRLGQQDSPVSSLALWHMQNCNKPTGPVVVHLLSDLQKYR